MMREDARDEVIRCAVGVVATAAPGTIYHSVVAQWWDALKSAIGHLHDEDQAPEQGDQTTEVDQ